MSSGGKIEGGYVVASMLVMAPFAARRCSGALSRSRVGYDFDALSRSVASDVAVAILFIAFGILVVVGALSTRMINVHDPLGPMFFPVLGGIIIVLASLVVVAQVSRRVEASDARVPMPGQELAAAALVVAYVGVFPLVPFVFSTWVMLVSCLRLAGIRDLKVLATLSTAATAALYYGFAVGMRTLLP
jgi:hypothetical protein